MPLQHLLIIYLIGTLLVLLPAYGLAPLFQKAGEKPWKAWVPFYNTWVMQKLAGRPVHWVFWQFIPVVGWFITPGIFIEFAKAFNQFSFGQHTMASLFAPFYFPWLARHRDTRFIGREGVSKHEKKSWREWVDAAIFAIVAATLIRAFVFEAYVIPSGSMQKTLLVKDFLFVSKFSYGPRVPNTPLSFPFVHNYMPVTNGKSYSELIKIPYIRWFASEPKRGDVVVFNFPMGDTVIHLPNYESAQPYYDLVRAHGRERVWQEFGQYIVVHPLDKSDNYIKRCVAVAGDTLEIIEGDVYINKVKQDTPPYSARTYEVRTKAGYQFSKTYLEDMGVIINDGSNGSSPDLLPTTSTQVVHLILTEEERDIVAKSAFVESITPVTEPRPSVNEALNSPIFPHDTLQLNSLDNFGPLWIPKKDATLQLTPENYPAYYWAISRYEGNDFYQKDGKFYLNGQETNSYTFKMNYYWMMGDNRHGSQDSRYWGFVPEDRIVGKAWLIWFSWEGGPRWKRLFKRVR